MDSSLIAAILAAVTAIIQVLKLMGVIKIPDVVPPVTPPSPVVVPPAPVVVPPAPVDPAIHPKIDAILQILQTLGPLLPLLFASAVKSAKEDASA